jgi:DNA-binding GntR family transcriptional regulator
VVDPRYRQIADDLRDKIESGKLARGMQLPTELELRKCYDTSRNTVRDALRWLARLGLVQTRAGQGTFVVDEIDAFLTALADAPELHEDLAAPISSGPMTCRRAPSAQNVGRVPGRISQRSASTPG